MRTRASPASGTAREVTRLSYTRDTDRLGRAFLMCCAPTCVGRLASHSVEGPLAAPFATWP